MPPVAFPCRETSVTPYCRHSTLNRATASRFSTAVGIGPYRLTISAPADPSAELVQLRDAEHVGPVDDQRVGVGNVEAGFDDRRRNQDVVGLLPEADHDLLERALGHLAVGDRDASLGDDLGQLRG